MVVTTLTKKDLTSLDKKGILSPKMELFCYYYAGSKEFFSNGTRAYAKAYGYEIDWETAKYGKGKEQKAENKKINTCATCAGRLLRNDQITERCYAIAQKLMSDGAVDFELYKVVQQDIELPSKMRAIEHVNKLRKRVVDDPNDKKVLIGIIGQVYTNTTPSEVEKINDIARVVEE